MMAEWACYKCTSCIFEPGFQEWKSVGSFGDKDREQKCWQLKMAVTTVEMKKVSGRCATMMDKR
jgi:hypothetical protein